MFSHSTPQDRLTLFAGFEYWSDSSDGYITWQTAGVESARLGASALGPDPLPDGTGVSQRLISVEPMVSPRLPNFISSDAYILLVHRLQLGQITYVHISSKIKYINKCSFSKLADNRPEHDDLPS